MDSDPPPSQMVVEGAGQQRQENRKHKTSRKPRDKKKGEKGANPRAFSFSGSGRAKASQARSADREQKRLHGEPAAAAAPPVPCRNQLLLTPIREHSVDSRLSTRGQLAHLVRPGWAAPCCAVLRCSSCGGHHHAGRGAAAAHGAGARPSRSGQVHSDPLPGQALCQTEPRCGRGGTAAPMVGGLLLLQSKLGRPALAPPGGQAPGRRDDRQCPQPRQCSAAACCPQASAAETPAGVLEAHAGSAWGASATCLRRGAPSSNGSLATTAAGSVCGPVTVVAGKQRRITFVECPSDMASMMDAAKVGGSPPPPPAPEQACMRWTCGDASATRHEHCACYHACATLCMAVCPALWCRRLACAGLRWLAQLRWPQVDGLPALLVQVADLVLLLVDGAFGFEMETFEFLNLLQVPAMALSARGSSALAQHDPAVGGRQARQPTPAYAAAGPPPPPALGAHRPACPLLAAQVAGFPKVMGVLTHLDGFTDPKKLKKTKKALKQRFWTEVYDGAKVRRAPQPPAGQDMLALGHACVPGLCCMAGAACAYCCGLVRTPCACLLICSCSTCQASSTAAT